jgi:hypothetical protein
MENQAQINHRETTNTNINQDKTQIHNTTLLSIETGYG